MAKKLQIITVTKADAVFASATEALAAYASDANAPTLSNYMIVNRGTNVETTASWDQNTQTLTINRLWDPAVYDAFVSQYATQKEEAKTNLLNAGWSGFSQQVSDV